MWGEGPHARERQRCRKQVEAAGRAEFCAGETSERMAVWSSSHRASSPRQEVWSLLLLSFLTCWDSLDEHLLGHTSSLCIKPPHPLRMRKAAQKLRVFALRWFVFPCVTVFLSGVRRSNEIRPKAKSHVTNPSAPHWLGDSGPGAQITSPAENRYPRRRDRSWLSLPDRETKRLIPKAFSRIKIGLCFVLCIPASPAIKIFAEFKSSV